MPAPTIADVFRVVGLPELRYTAGGSPVCQLRLVSGGEDKDGKKADELWIDATLWGSEAEEVANTIQDKQLVIVIGRVVTRSWDDKTTGAKRSKTEIKVWHIGPKIRKPREVASGSGDPWASAPPAADSGYPDTEPPF